MARTAWHSGLVVCLVAMTLVGCDDSPQVASVRAELESHIAGAEFEEEYHMRFGSFRMGIAKTLAGWALADDDELKPLLKKIKRLDIGTYRVVSLPPIDEIEPPQGLMSTLSEAGWTLIVNAQEFDEHVWMFMRQEDRAIRNIYIAVLDEYELTMVSLEGKLDELLKEAIADDPIAFATGIAS